jgi:hypothetical protein
MTDPTMTSKKILGPIFPSLMMHTFQKGVYQSLNHWDEDWNGEP